MDDNNKMTTAAEQNQTQDGGNSGGINNPDKHYLYMRDPGPRNNDGWYCYETTMKGLVRNCWCAYVPKEEKKETAKVVYYYVKKGDTLSSIAKKYETTYQAIAKENSIKDANKIKVGQKLKITTKK